jgi:hypothetical protein
MADVSSFLGQGTMSIREDAASESPLITASFFGGQYSSTNDWIVMSMDMSALDGGGVFTFEVRNVGGIAYTHDPSTGTWDQEEITTEPGDLDPIGDLTQDELDLIELGAEEVPDGYLLTGVEEEDDGQVMQVELVVGTDFVLRKAKLQTTQPRDEMVPPLDPEGGDLYAEADIAFTGFDVEVGEVLAPPNDLSTFVWGSEAAPMSIHVPADWLQVPEADLEPESSAEFFSEDGNLGLVIVEEDLEALGVGAASLEQYVQFLESFVFEPTGFAVTERETIRTVQGEPAQVLWLEDGSGLVRGGRLVYLHDETMAFNAGFFGPKQSFEDSTDMIEFIFNTLIVDTGSVFSLHVGDCFDDPADFADVSDVIIVGCSEPHDNEVYANLLVEFDSFPGTQAMQETADEMCLPEFETYVGRDWETSALDYGWLYPTADSWADGDRIVTCFLYDGSLEKLTGSMRNSGV